MQTKRWRQPGERARAALLLAALVLCAPSGAAAQDLEFSSQQANSAQYVFVVDDSGSMRISDRGLPPADADRLAVFAVRATLSMLDDRDEATVIRLNGPTTAAPIAPLSDNRARLEGELRLNATLAQYGGRNTFCERALDAAKSALNAAQRPGVSQVVMFLTDGRCEDNPTVQKFLSGLQSHDEGLFTFYLLRFKGRDFSPALADLAKATEGEVLETSATDPTAILFPFASALSRSQGYEAYLLDPRNSQLDAHRGARRVRLLAVAPGTGAAIDFKIDPVAKGDAPKRVGGTKAGSHRYEQGRTFRYAALDYRPGTVPVKISAANAGSDWKIVAVPEYRLFADLSAYAGACSARGPKVLHVDVGETVCVRVRLVNENGEVVPADIAGIGSQAEVSYEAPGAAPTKLAAEREGNAASFLLEFAKLDGGFHVFKPRVRVAVPGRKGEVVTIAGASKTLQVTSTTARAEPSSLDFGTVVPGRKAHQKIKLQGNFTPTTGTLRVQNREDIPDCLRFELSGKAEGVKQALSPGQEYQVSMIVDPYCGPTPLTRAVNPTLQIEFDGSNATQVVPTVTVPLKLRLDSKISSPPALNVNVRAGRVEAVSFGITGNFESPLQVAALLQADDRREQWPANRKHLQLSFLDENNGIIRKDGENALSTTATFEPGGTDNPVRIRVRAAACCEGGTYRTTVLLKPLNGKGITVPLIVNVEEGSAWECWGGRVLGVLGGLLGLLLLLFLYNIYKKTHFWNKKRLMTRLKVLEWNGNYPDISPSNDRDVRRVIQKHLKFGDRLAAWLKANPLKLGLPGTPPYREVLRINFVEPRYTTIRVESEETLRKLYDKSNGSPYVYYQTNNSNGLYFVPSDDGHIGGTRIEGWREVWDPEDPRPVNYLRLVFDEDKSDGEWAGWEIGS